MAKSKKTKTRKIDMAEHDYRLKSLGISERASRTIIRFAILAIPVLLIIFWITKTIN